MTRRIAVLTAGVVLLVLFGLLGTTLPVPYVAQVPGPTFNTLGDIDGDPIISIEGRDRNDVSGNLNLTTVGVSRGGLSLVQAVRGWFDDEVAVVPEESVYPPGPLGGGDPPGQPRGVPDVGAGGGDRGPGAPRLPGEGRGPGACRRARRRTTLLVEGDAIDAVDGRPTPDADALAGRPDRRSRAGPTVTVD